LPEFNKVINAIYGAADGSVSWDCALIEIADYCGVANAALVFAAPQLQLAEVATPRADPGVVADYSARWWAHDPTIPATMSAPVGQITSLKDTDHDVFLKSAFHNEYWQHSGLGAERLASNLLQADGAFASIVLQASPQLDEISNQTARRFASILPHLMRSVRLRKRLCELELGKLASEVKQRGNWQLAIIVDALGRPVLDFPGLGHLPEGLRLHKGRLRHIAQTWDTQLHALIHSCSEQSTRLRGGKIAIRCNHGKGDFGMQIEVLPLPGGAHFMAIGIPRPVAIVVVTDHSAQDHKLFERLRDTYALTPAEARLAIEVISGEGRNAAAARLGISLSTVRTHLSRVFEKTGTQRQAELVRVVSQLAAKD
jgi:DNA-binding CsgD family transcriptional regulator